MTGDRAGTEVDASGWGARHAHDPTAVRDDDGTYWLFSTDAYADGPLPRGGVQVRRSTDLARWEWHGWALDGVPAPAAAWSGADGLWAPDVVRAPGGGWRMYYSASTFGSRTSAIGLATAPQPAGPWTDRGLVVTSRHEVDGPNAIDANAVVDAAGRHWLVYGSFFGGIHALPLDPGTGLVPTDRGDPGVLLARRSRAVDGAIEGAFVLPRPGGGYVLLTSQDSLFDTYHLRVAAGPEVTGPFHDALGRSTVDDDDAGTTVLGGHRFTGGPGRLAPGHASVLTDGERQLLVHHVRDADDPTQHEVQVRRIVWTRDGWPLVSPQPWAGAREAPAPWPDSVDALTGEWETVRFARGDALTPSARRTVTAADLASVTAHGAGRFSWAAPAADSAPAVRGAEVVVFPSWDAVREHPALSFAALDDSGVVTVGTRIDPPDRPGARRGPR